MGMRAARAQAAAVCSFANGEVMTPLDQLLACRVKPEWRPRARLALRPPAYTRDCHEDASREPCITASTSTRSAKTT